MEGGSWHKYRRREIRKSPFRSLRRPGFLGSQFRPAVTLTKPKPENLVLNLICNLLVPTSVLIWFSKDQYLGPVWGLIVALVFPLGYGIYDLATRKKTNFLSVLGFLSVLASGGLALGQFGGIWFAVKDAVLPTVLGFTVLASLRSKSPLVKELFFNEQFIDLPRVEAALATRGNLPQFEALLRRASLGLAATFIATAPVSFALALYVLRSPPKTAAFNAELGKMHWLALIVIAVPSVGATMWVFSRLVTGLEKLTGLTQDEIFRTPPPKEKT
jgi:hypothetical protein